MSQQQSKKLSPLPGANGGENRQQQETQVRKYKLVAGEEDQGQKVGDTEPHKKSQIQ